MFQAKEVLDQQLRLGSGGSVRSLGSMGSPGSAGSQRSVASLSSAVSIGSTGSNKDDKDSNLGRWTTISAAEYWLHQERRRLEPTGYVQCMTKILT